MTLKELQIALEKMYGENFSANFPTAALIALKTPASVPEQKRPR